MLCGYIFVAKLGISKTPTKPSVERPSKNLREQVKQLITDSSPKIIWQLNNSIGE
jgi:hypothetical protein